METIAVRALFAGAVSVQSHGLRQPSAILLQEWFAAMRLEIVVDRVLEISRFGQVEERLDHFVELVGDLSFNRSKQALP